MINSGDMTELDAEASEFAAHLLVPPNLLLAEVGKLKQPVDGETACALLAKRFKVSETLMAYRLTQEGFQVL